MLRNFWSPKYEQTIRFNDPSIGINWPLEVTKVHDRDRCAPTLETMDILPNYNKNHPMLDNETIAIFGASGQVGGEYVSLLRKNTNLIIPTRVQLNLQLIKYTPG